MGKVRIAWKYSLLAFVISGLFAVSFYLVGGIYPGSSKTILIYDELGQYTGIWGYGRYLFQNSSNLFYNWSLSLGGNNLCQMAYYVGNPINLIVGLFPIKCMPTVVYYLTISKFAFAGLFFSLYLIVCRKDYVNKWLVLLFSLCYSMMSYMVMYAMSLMWLDAVILLPIVIMGLEILIKKSKPSLFIFSLVLLFYTNFYIAYMIVLFSFMYFVWFEIREKRMIKDGLHDFLLYSISGIISAMLASPCLIVAFKGLQLGKRQENRTLSFSFTANLIDILKKLFSCQYDTIQSDGTPSLFVGTALLLLVMCFFVLNRERLVVKLVSLGIFTFLILSFWISPLYMIWHGFIKPVCFPARFSFLFSFFVIVIAIEGINSIKKFYEMKREIRWIGLLKKYVIPLFYVFMFVEIWLNASYILGWVRMETECISAVDYEKIVVDTEDVISQIPKEDLLHYRADSADTLGKNDPMLFGYKGISSFSSTYNNSVLEFVDKLGICKKHCVLMSKDATPFALDILSCKYYYSNRENSTYIPRMSEIYVGNEYSLYQNGKCLPIGFSIENNEPVQELFSEDVFNNNNLLAKSMSGMDGMFVKNDTVVDEKMIGEYERQYDITVTANNDGPLYIFFTGEPLAEYKTRIRAKQEKESHKFLFHEADTVIATFGENQYIDIKEAGNTAYYIDDLKKGDCVSVKIESCLNLGEIISYSLNENVYHEVIDKLGENVFVPSENKKTVYSGMISNPKGKTFFFSIPCIPGLKAYLDGERVDIQPLYKSFVGLTIPKGEHELEIYYVPPGLYTGLILFVAGIVLVIIFLKVTNSGRRRFVGECK